MTTDYQKFIESKSQFRHEVGFDPGEMPEFLFDFQKYLVEWACKKGRAAIFADCGLGKTAMQLAWADRVIKETNQPALIVTPLAVGAQTVQEAAKFGIEAQRTRNGVFDGRKCVWVTNYEQLSKYDPSQFGGVVCDESSAIKDFKSQRKSDVVDFMRTIRYRLLCTATAAPNDFWELGTSSEALGLLGFRDMITTFFKQETSKDHKGWGRTKYRFRGHAEEPFWAWVCSWSRSLRSPADMGYPAEAFDLPALLEKEHIIRAKSKRDGWLFDIPASNMQEEREERRRTIEDRTDKVLSLIDGRKDQTIIWCELNDEGTSLSRKVPDSVEVRGSMGDEEKEEAFIGFASGQIKNLIIKPKIGAWGLNFQNCCKVCVFPSHSFEQYYQAVRRCWRFGQTQPVMVDLVLSEGQEGVLKNLKRKQVQTEQMFASIVKHMQDAMHLVTEDYFPESERLPKWL